MLQWLRKHGCPWDEWTCAMAAAGGHLKVLKWARKHGCPWVEDDDGCGWSAKGRGLLSSTFQLNVSAF